MCACVCACVRVCARAHACVCIRSSLHSVRFWQLLCCAHKRIVNIMKVYIGSNNMQVELTRFRKKYRLYSRLFCEARNFPTDAMFRSMDLCDLCEICWLLSLSRWVRTLQVILIVYSIIRACQRLDFIYATCCVIL